MLEVILNEIKKEGIKEEEKEKMLNNQTRKHIDEKEGQSTIMGVKQRERKNKTKMIEMKIIKEA